MKYYIKNGTLTTSFVVYRDRVEEGQISHVHITEVKLLEVFTFSFILMILQFVVINVHAFFFRFIVNNFMVEVLFL